MARCLCGEGGALTLFRCSCRIFKRSFSHLLLPRLEQHADELLTLSGLIKKMNSVNGAETFSTVAGPERAKLMKPFPTRRYLDPSDFYKVGILASVVTAAVIITLGYVIMRAIGL